MLATLGLVLLAVVIDGKAQPFGRREDQTVILTAAKAVKKSVVSADAVKPAAGGTRKRVAVVMTGSPRSFVFPLVYNSIKKNLIDALQADVDVFARIITQDNVHANGMGGNGMVVNASQKMKTALQEALAAIQPKATSFVTIAQEKEEKIRLFASEEAAKKKGKANAEKHEIFQTYDARRYSMFFNRHMVYNMAKAYEKAHGFKYDWFVHARPDTGWVGPVEPLSHYSDKVVWVPDRWQEYCPDTFALIPARFAEVYFDLDHKLQDKGKVFCLGGPDFDKKFCKKDHLQTLQLPAGRVEKVLEHCCLVDPWGHSEGILQHLLKLNQVPTDGAPFYVFIARDHRLNEYCNSLHPNKAWILMNVQKPYFKDGAMDYWIRSNSGLAGCYDFANRYLCKIQTSLHKAVNHQGRSVSVSKMSDFDCPARSENAESVYNYVPSLVRLKGSDKCLTATKSNGLDLQPCEGVSVSVHSQYFFTHGKRLRALGGRFQAGMSPSQRQCAQGTSRKQVILSTSACKNKEGEFEFLWDQSVAVQYKSVDPNMLTTIKSASLGLCLTASADQKHVQLADCAPAGKNQNQAQLFAVTSAGDYSVLEKPKVSNFKWDGANALSCCSKTTSNCCDWKMRFDLSDAEYKKAVSRIHR